MSGRRGSGGEKRRVSALTVALAACCLALSGPAAAALLPEGFFDRMPAVTDAQAGVEADELQHNSDTGDITAYGDVHVTYAGYSARSDRMVFNQRSKNMELIGNVAISDPEGTQYTADRVVLTGQFKNAILDSMVMLAEDGSMVTATQTRQTEDGRTVLEKGTYAPCGTCIDAKGRRIGWRLRTQRMTSDKEGEYFEMEHPVLEVLGVPIAWFPWMRVPDPSDPSENGFRMPSYEYSKQIGLKVNIPYFYRVNPDISLLFTTSLVSEQGVLLTGEVNHEIDGLGSYMLRGSGIYQLDRSKFAGQLGDKDFRGSLQTTGRFVPVEDFAVGWSYTAFTDPAYLTTYFVPTANPVVNEAYVEHLSPDTFAEVRAQEFILLGEIPVTSQNRQGRALPLARFEHVRNLGPGTGEFRASGTLLGVDRVSDAPQNTNGVPFVLGHAGSKIHGTLEASWRRQFITGGGLVATPIAGVRADAAHYDGRSPLMPGATSLFNITPFAAIDMRWPLRAEGGDFTHVVEPIAQVVYRASDVTKVGITNDNAQSFVFDDSNLFGLNRFSGTDRQETGLRANVGGRYQVTHLSGSYLDVIAGQSFHIAGQNAFAISDAAYPAAGSGLAGRDSYMVAGVTGALSSWLKFGGKMQVDPATARITRGALAAQVLHAGWYVGADYSYMAANPAVGRLTDQHDVGTYVRFPIADYWEGSVGLGWDITAGRLVDYSASVTYNDGYVMIGGSVTSPGPTLFDPSVLSYKLNFRLMGPDGKGFGI